MRYQEGKHIHQSINQSILPSHSFSHSLISNSNHSSVAARSVAAPYAPQTKKDSGVSDPRYCRFFFDFLRECFPNLAATKMVSATFNSKSKEIDRQVRMQQVAGWGGLSCCLIFTC